jgi:hypothetical protein
MPKKEVLYRKDENTVILVGHPTFVRPVNHPTILSGNLARTSTVLSYDRHTGHFETENSRYIPLNTL